MRPQRIVLGLVLTALLAGCAAAGLQWSTVTLDRDELLWMRGDIKADAREFYVLASLGCQAATAKTDVQKRACDMLEDAHKRALAGDQWLHRKVQEKRALTIQDFQSLVGVANELGGIARLFGYAVPTIPTLPR